MATRLNAKLKGSLLTLKDDLDRPEVLMLPKTLVDPGQKIMDKLQAYSDECEKAIKDLKPSPLSFGEDEVQQVCRDAHHQQKVMKPVLESLKKAKAAAA